MSLQVPADPESENGSGDRPSEEYDEMIADLREARDEITRKIDNGRIRDSTKDQARIKYLRALGYLIRSQLKVIETRELTDLEQRVERLESEVDQAGTESDV